MYWFRQTGMNNADEHSCGFGHHARLGAVLATCIGLATCLFFSTASAAATITRTVSYDYDLATGLLVKETIEPDDTALTSARVLTRDGFGNTTAVIHGGRKSTTIFDVSGRFIVGNLNALNHQNSYVKDPAFGNTASMTDPNNLETRWEYDSLGRKVLEVHPDGTKTVYGYTYCAQESICPTNGAFVLHSERQNSNGVKIGAWSKIVFDRLGRSILNLSEGDNSNVIAVETIYDKFGRVAKKSRPYFLTGPDAGTPVYRESTYDVLGREKTVTAPNGGVTQFSYTALQITVTNALGQTTVKTLDSRGNLISSVDANLKTATYKYDPFGNLTEVRDMAGNVISTEYDKLGRKIALIDPDKGAWHYTYDLHNDMRTLRNPNNRTTSMRYDKLGRIISAQVYLGAEDTIYSYWTYDSAANAVGKLVQSSIDYDFREGLLHTRQNQELDVVLDPLTNDNFIYQALPGDVKSTVRDNSHWIATKTLTYDNLSRPVTTTTSMWGQNHKFVSTYDENGRLDKTSYPSGLQVMRLYDSLGQVRELRRSDDGSNRLLWRADSRDAERHVTAFTQGNYLQTRRTYNPDDGLVTHISTGHNNTVADLEYVFDKLATLRQRKDNVQGLTEDFGYDMLNRLTSYAINGGTAKTVTYDDTGNITSKSDVGTYSYPAAGTARPHAVQTVSGAYNANYTYDDRGNMTTGGGLSVTWYVFDKIESITQGSTQISYIYGADKERLSQTVNNVRTEYYRDTVSGFMAERVAYQGVRWNNYLFAEGEMVGVHFEHTDGSEEIRYYTSDHLGSISVLTDEQGNVVERLSYDAWGKRRYPDGSDDVAGVLTSETSRGYTGHEMIDEVDLVNMNGRVYNPIIGRFASADPFIQDFTASQTWNRYTYVSNNPLSYTDPSGFISISDSIYLPDLDLLVGIDISALMDLLLSWGGIDDESVEGVHSGRFHEILTDPEAIFVERGLTSGEEVSELAAGGSVVRAGPNDGSEIYRTKGNESFERLAHAGVVNPWEQSTAEIKTSIGAQGGLKFGLRKVVFGRVEVNFGAVGIDTNTNRRTYYEGYGLNIEVLGWSFGGSIERKVDLNAIDGLDDVLPIALMPPPLNTSVIEERGYEFSGSFGYEGVSLEEMRRLEIGGQAIIGLEASVDLY